MALMSTRTQLVLLAIILLITLVGGYAIGTKIEQMSAARSYAELLSSRESVYEEVTVVRTRAASLEKSLHELSDKNTELLDLVAQLQARPDQIRYITVTETVIQPSDPIVEVLDLPAEYLFKLREDLTIARFAYDVTADLPYTFETYELTFKNSVVISDKNSSGLLQISSSADPDKYIEFPIDSLEVRSISEQPMFEPNVGLSLTLSASQTPDLLGSVFVSFLHPHKNVDVLGVRVAVNGQAAQFGLDLVGYNIAAHLPVLTDFWVYGGVAIDIYAQPSGHLSVGTKF